MFDLCKMPTIYAKGFEQENHITSTGYDKKMICLIKKHYIQLYDEMVND